MSGSLLPSRASAEVALYSKDAEASALGACMFSTEALEDVFLRVTRDDFFVPDHQKVYDVISELRALGAAVDERAVAEELSARRTDEDPKLLVWDLVHSAGIGALAHRDALFVKKHAKRRRALQITTAVQGAVADGTPLADLHDQIEELRRLAIAEEGRELPSLTDGASFVLDAPASTPTLWGNAAGALWASGESLMIVGPPGVGKTTLVQQLALARCGLRRDLLGFEVVEDERRVLYIAADRPSQARRSLGRMVGDEDRDALAKKLLVWRGPLIDDLVRRPSALAHLAEANGAGTIIIDSLKDVAFELSQEETAGRANQAIQIALTAGVELVVLHHQRKAQQGGKPTSLADVYGSMLITAGAGSVVLLWGDPGDAIVELTHLKQPGAEVGPLRIAHDHSKGESSVVTRPDAFTILTRASKGLTAQDAARLVYESDSPTRNEIERARRQLDALVARGRAHKRDGKSGGKGGGKAARWYSVSAPTESVHEYVHAGPSGEDDHDSFTAFSEEGGTPDQSGHATVHGVHGAGRSRSSPSLIEGERAPGIALQLVTGALDAEVVEEAVTP